jgi:hypothetical protein
VVKIALCFPEQKSSGHAVTALEIAWLALSLTTIVGITVLLVDKRLRR